MLVFFLGGGLLLVLRFLVLLLSESSSTVSGDAARCSVTGAGGMFGLESESIVVFTAVGRSGVAPTYIRFWAAAGYLTGGDWSGFVLFPLVPCEGCQCCAVAWFTVLLGSVSSLPFSSFSFGGGAERFDGGLGGVGRMIRCALCLPEFSLFAGLVSYVSCSPSGLFFYTCVCSLGWFIFLIFLMS